MGPTVRATVRSRQALVQHLTVIVAAGAAIITAGPSYVATRRGTRKQLKDALAARLDAEAAEHRRWLRDRTVAVYVDMMRMVRDARSG